MGVELTDNKKLFTSISKIQKKNRQKKKFKKTLIQNTTDQNISQLNDKFDKFSLTKRQDSGIAGSPMSGDSQLDLEEMDAKVGDLTINENDDNNNSLQLVDLRQNSQSNSDSGHENDAADQMLTINKKITKSSKNDEDTSEKSSTANSNN